MTQYNFIAEVKSSFNIQTDRAINVLSNVEMDDGYFAEVVILCNVPSGSVILNSCERDPIGEEDRIDTWNVYKFRVPVRSAGVVCLTKIRLVYLGNYCYKILFGFYGSKKFVVGNSATVQRIEGRLKNFPPRNFGGGGGYEGESSFSPSVSRVVSSPQVNHFSSGSIAEEFMDPFKKVSLASGSKEKKKTAKVKHGKKIRKEKESSEEEDEEEDEIVLEEDEEDDSSNEYSKESDLEDVEESDDDEELFGVKEKKKRKRSVKLAVHSRKRKEKSGKKKKLRNPGSKSELKAAGSRGKESTEQIVAAAKEIEKLEENPRTDAEETNE